MQKRISRIDEEIVNEESIEVNGGTVRLKKNLGPLSLTKFMAASREGEIRGLMIGDDIYYWDAYQATHKEVADAFGVPLRPDDRVFVWRTENGQVLIDLNEPVDEPSGPLTAIASSPNIYFLGTNGKWKAAPLAA